MRGLQKNKNNLGQTGRSFNGTIVTRQMNKGKIHAAQPSSLGAADQPADQVDAGLRFEVFT